MFEFNVEYEVALSKLLSARSRVRLAEQAYMHELAKFSMKYPNNLYPGAWAPLVEGETNNTLDTVAVALQEKCDRIVRLICRERCSYLGVPACWALTDNQNKPLPWPNPNCSDPACQALAVASMLVMMEG